MARILEWLKRLLLRRPNVTATPTGKPASIGTESNASTSTPTPTDPAPKAFHISKWSKVLSKTEIHNCIQSDRFLGRNMIVLFLGAPGIGKTSLYNKVGICSSCATSGTHITDSDLLTTTCVSVVLQ